MIDVTASMVEEHRLILRMIALLEKNIDRMQKGLFDDWGFFLDAVDFIRSYADRFHHAKEEDVLFAELVNNGMPAKRSPVEAMLIAHDQGRAYVAAMEAGAKAVMAGDVEQVAAIYENARGYADLLRDHIDKENNILYPLAERVLPAEVRPRMVEAYRAAEAAAPAGLAKRYAALVERYEAQA